MNPEAEMRRWLAVCTERTRAAVYDACHQDDRARMLRHAAEARANAIGWASRCDPELPRVAAPRRSRATAKVKEPA